MFIILILFLLLSAPSHQRLCGAGQNARLPFRRKDVQKDRLASADPGFVSTPSAPGRVSQGPCHPSPGSFPFSFHAVLFRVFPFQPTTSFPPLVQGLGLGHTVRRLAWHGQAITQTCMCQDSPRPLGTVPSVPRSSPTTPSPVTGAPRRGPAMGMVLDAQPGPAVLGKGGLIGKTRPSWKTQSRERSLGVRGKWRGGA